MKLKVLCVSFMTLLVALAVNPANASPSSNKELIEGTSKYQAYLMICFKGKRYIPDNCEELFDTRGPYKSKKKCMNRIYEMRTDLPKYKPEFKAKGYICEKDSREDLTFSKLKD